MPKKRLISGMLDYVSQCRKEFFRRFLRNLEIERVGTKVDLIRPLNSSALTHSNFLKCVIRIPGFEDAFA